jgi:probable H4MPT-linked C1 transfer pathway protein
VSSSDIVGWDLGGAHLKAAHVDDRGAVRRVIQLPCPLWLGLDQLRRAVDEVLAAVPARIRYHAVTMTGELADLFESRVQGVQQLAAVMEEKLAPAAMGFYAGGDGFIQGNAVASTAEKVSSSNWLASASFVARCVSEALFIDIGSTTTDVVICRDGDVLAYGSNDHRRLVSGELVYTGVVRTSLMAETEKVPFRGEWVALMAEHFASMADVYRVTGELPLHADQLPSADGGPKTLVASARRLARMLGLDLEAAPMEDWTRFASYLSELQLQRLMRACQLSLSRGVLGQHAVVLGAGVGRFLVTKLADRLQRQYMDFSSLLDTGSLQFGDPADCTPAVAVANLARIES